MRQTNLKLLIAYSSVAHVGIVIGGKKSRNNLHIKQESNEEKGKNKTRQNYLIGLKQDNGATNKPITTNKQNRITSNPTRTTTPKVSFLCPLLFCLVLPSLVQLVVTIKVYKI
jgi:hypothetical protein